MDKTTSAKITKITSLNPTEHTGFWWVVPVEQPFRCPVCSGRGVLPMGFYNPYPEGSASNTANEPCRTCTGAGVIWREGHV